MMTEYQENREKYRKLLLREKGRQQKAVICGAGNVGLETGRLLKDMDFSVTFIEDRQEFADAAKEAGADRVLCGDFSTSLAQIDGDRDTWFIIMTREHEFDRICLRDIAIKPHAYIGMMGSRRRTKILIDSLEDEGIDRQVLDSVHTPIGLSINADTPFEIAVSIAAEIISLKNAGKHDDRADLEVLETIAALPDSERAIAAKIINARGSVPRGVGALMLIHPNGSISGTIGGGSSEYAVMKRAEEKFSSGDSSYEEMTLDLAGNDVNAPEMLCGGRIVVSLETI
ncbi:MAG: XdhC family protein [Lachnospiraceae bacterium]|nr:XdhC family protein [Lachnospiraceae bacterium]